MLSFKVGTLTPHHLTADQPSGTCSTVSTNMWKCRNHGQLGSSGTSGQLLVVSSSLSLSSQRSVHIPLFGLVCIDCWASKSPHNSEYRSLNWVNWVSTQVTIGNILHTTSSAHFTTSFWSSDDQCFLKYIIFCFGFKTNSDISSTSIQDAISYSLP